jgi:hypothetical protein
VVERIGCHRQRPTALTVDPAVVEILTQARVPSGLDVDGAVVPTAVAAAGGSDDAARPGLEAGGGVLHPLRRVRPVHPIPAGRDRVEVVPRIRGPTAAGRATTATGWAAAAGTAPGTTRTAAWRATARPAPRWCATATRAGPRSRRAEPGNRPAQLRLYGRRQLDLAPTRPPRLAGHVSSAPR